MKAAWYEKTGEAQTVLQIGELDNPVPNKGEVLVKLKTSGINPSDVKTRAGARGELQFPKIIPHSDGCLLYTSPSPRDLSTSRMPSSA